MRLLILKELDFLLSLLSFDILSLSISLVDGLDLRLKLTNFIFKLRLFVLQLFNGSLEVGLSVLGLQLLSHGEGHRRLIQGLISRDRHFDFVSNSEKEETSLWLRKCNLPDNLIEALAEELLSDWADTALSGLSLHELLIEHFSKSGHIDSGGGLMTDVLDEVLARFNPLSWWKNSVKDVLAAWFSIHWWQLLLLGTEALLEWVVHVVASRNLDRILVLD